jgi:hypothetical protein
VACTAATLLALSKLTREFDDLARDYAQRTFEPGQRVIVWPTGHVYRYAGIAPPRPEYAGRFIQLETLKGNNKRTIAIEDVLRLEPTTKTTKPGKVNTPLSNITQRSALDILLDIQSHGNTSMLRNRVLYLTSKSGFERFLSSTECSRCNGTVSNAVALAEALPWGTVKEDGTGNVFDAMRNCQQWFSLDLISV